MNIIDVIILSVVEGITEFLPISSTGHLILASHILQIKESDFLKSFEIVIQFGAILSVLFLYGRSHLSSVAMLKKIVVAFLPTAILGLLFYGVVKKYLLGNEMVVLLALGIGGVLIIVFELMLKGKESSSHELSVLSYKQAFLIGVCQSIALIPGVSRSAATVIGARFLGLNMKGALEFSFLLSLPTIISATGLDLVKNAHIFSSSNVILLVLGVVFSFLVATLSIRFLLVFVKKYSFAAFGVYRIILAFVFWIVFF